jgi:CBS domain-containing protein
METALVAPSRVLSAASLLERSVANDEAYLDAGDSAFCALTDFRRDYPITVGADSPIDDALADMNRLGVHALLVTQEGVEGVTPQVVGLITAYDIERERPHRYPTTVSFGVRKHVAVGDIMTSWDELSLVKYDSLQTLTARDLYEMFQGTGLTHLLVVETHGDDSAVARGLLSRAILAKRLRRVRSAVQR